MDIESILIEGAGSGQAIGDINDDQYKEHPYPFLHIHHSVYHQN